MFSDNHRISGRQTFRILTYDLLGAGSLLVPGRLAKHAGCDGIFSIGIAVAGALLYMRLIAAVLSDMKEESFAGYMERICGKIAGKLVQFFYVFYFTLLAGYTAYQLTNIITTNLLREERFILVLIILLFLAAYGLAGGLEGRARVYEVVFWLVMTPLFLMLFFALDEICVDYWTPIVTAKLSGVLWGAWELFGWFALVFVILFLGNFVKKTSIIVHSGRTAVLFAGILYALLYLILLGIFGKNSLGEMEYPAITMMSTIKITGGFLKRTDAFMLAIWFFTLFALLGGCAFYGGKMLQSFLGRRVEGQKRYGCLILLAAFVFAELFYHSKNMSDCFEVYFRCVGTPVVVAIPLLLWLLKRKGKVMLGRKRRVQE